jgi:hypothetical protein
MRPQSCEAVSRPHMHFIPRKTVAQQDLQALHRVRNRLIGTRTQIGNQIRGLLAEYGIVLPRHLSHVRKALPQLTEENETRLSGFAKVWKRSRCVSSIRARLAFLFVSKLYRQMYAGTGIATDSARQSRARFWARLLAKPCRRLFQAKPLPTLEVPGPRKERTGIGGPRLPDVID